VDKKRCNHIDGDKVCAFTGEKCDNPADEDCPHYEPWNPDDHPGQEE